MVRKFRAGHKDGSRLSQTCRLAGIDERTQQRWRAHDGLGRRCAALLRGAVRIGLQHRLAVADDCQERLVPSIASVANCEFDALLAKLAESIARFQPLNSDLRWVFV